jgi:hypothetical protein
MRAGRSDKTVSAARNIARLLLFSTPRQKGRTDVDMKDHETRRKIIREWMALPKDKRHGEEQVATFAKKATQQNEFHRSRRDPDHKFRRDPYQKVMGWLLPRIGKS